MWSVIGALFTTLGQALGLVSKRQDLKNAANVQAAATAQKEQSAVDKTNKAIANQNTAELRNELSEN